MTAEIGFCRNGCARPVTLTGRYCLHCLEGFTPETEPAMCSDRYLTRCALELIRRGTLNAPLAEAVQEAARNLGSTP